MPNIVLRRTGALGDVLCATPIARILKESFPDSTLIVQTGSKAAFDGHPDVDQIIAISQQVECSKLVDLDMAYENRPDMHIVDAYLDTAFIRDAHKTILPHKKAVIFRPDIKTNQRRDVIAIHAARAWPSRTFPQKFWDTLIKLCLDRFGCQIWMLGSGGDYRGPVHERVRSFVGRTELIGAYRVIQAAQAFIASDSSLLHLAGATNTMIIGLFTCAKAEYRMPYRRKGSFGVDAAFITPLDCYGCLEKEPIPSTMLNCRRGDNACVESIDPVRIVDYLASSTLIPD